MARAVKNASLTQGEPQDFLALASQLRRDHEKTGESLSQLARRHGIGKRKAYYLIEIDKAFDRLGVPRDRLLGVGWTKLSAICSHVTSDNWNDLLTFAEKNPVHLLEDHLAGKTDAPRTNTVLLHLTDDQYALFKDVLVANGARAGPRGLADKEAALVAALKRVR